MWRGVPTRPAHPRRRYALKTAAMEDFATFLQLVAVPSRPGFCTLYICDAPTAVPFVSALVDARLSG